MPDFLLKDGSLHELWPKLGEDLVGLGHDRLRECCQNYLNTDLLPSNLWTPSYLQIEQVHLLGYTSSHILDQAARSVISIPAEQFLEQFRLDLWYETIRHIDEHCIRQDQELQPYTERPSLLYILAEYNCSDLIRALCRDGLRIGNGERRCHYPLLAALVKRHSQAPQALLDPQKLSTPPWLVFESEDYNSVENHEHPMLWTLQTRQTRAASLLLNAKDL